MQNNNNNVCRLCLKLEHSANNVDLLNEVMRQIFSLLSIKLDLNVSENPLMCGICAGVLDEIYSFKSKCLYTEDIINAHVETNSRVSLRDILIEIENTPNVRIGEDEVVCRLCMKIPPNCSYITLGKTGEELSPSRDMIQIYLPEIDLNITEKPIICDACHVCIKHYVSFATNCMAVEEKIKLYCDFQKSSGAVDLACVRQFMEEKAFNLQTGLSKDLVIKEEEGSVVVKVEKVQDAEDFISEGNFFDNGSASELVLKNEEIEIKLENNDLSEEMGESVPSGSSENSGKTVSLKGKRHIRQSAAKGKNRFSSDVHMARHRGLTKAYGCQECIFKTNRKHDLLRHMVRHKGMSEAETHKCENCEYETRYKKYMIRHMVKHLASRAERKFKCDKCPYETKIKCNLRTHNLMHKDRSEVEMHKCDSCEFETRYKSSLIQHIMVKHRDPKTERKFKCDKCPYETDFKSYLRVHSQTHKDKSEVEMHKCENCEYETRYKCVMKKHYMIHKDKSEVQMHKCDNCEYETKYKCYIKKHMLKHLDPNAERTFKCDKCSYGTDVKSYLRLHSLTHKDKSEVEMHKCENCEYETRYKSVMKTHCLIHKDKSEVHMHKCDNCGYETKYKCDIKKHMMKHVESRAESNLRVDNLRHKDRSELVMYKCDNCEHEYRHKGSMVKHMRRKHCDPKEQRKF